MSSSLPTFFTLRAGQNGSAPTLIYASSQSRPIIFISDLHLSPLLPKTTARFSEFIQEISSKASALFILGDFFEYWIGDDMLQHDIFYRNIANQLRTLIENGFPVLMMPGNRDFLITQGFADFSKVFIIPDPIILDAFCTQILLSHGDALCVNDKKYQLFRHFVRHPLTQKIFLSLPYSLRNTIARCLRQSHHPYQAQCPPQYDVSTQAVEDLITQTKTSFIIHGHTHQPHHYHYPKYQRWVLSDWELDHQPYRANYLQLDQNGLNAYSLILESIKD